MKSTLLKWILILIPVYLFSCQQPEQHSTPEAEAHVHTATQETAPITPVVQLNSGQKWKANPETTEGINKMMGIIKNRMDAKSTPQSMAGPLNEAFQEIIQQCTMEGEAHEQLHHFLIPVREHLKALNSPEASIDSVASLVNHLGTYTQYFE